MNDIWEDNINKKLPRTSQEGIEILPNQPKRRGLFLLVKKYFKTIGKTINK